MQKIISRLESKFGRFAISNLIGLLVIGQVAVYVLILTMEDEQAVAMLGYLQCSANLVLAGEPWRLLTFLFMPVQTNILFAFFYYYLFFFYGSTLEAVWGSFRLNFYLLIGYLATVIVLFAFGDQNLPATNVYLYASLFFAFSKIFPDFVLNLYGILPIKIKWLAILAALQYLYIFVVATQAGAWGLAAMIFAGVFAFFLFFGRETLFGIKQKRRKKKFEKQVKKASSQMVHLCTSCGKNSKKNPELVFRYCSKCLENNCYCLEHIQAHSHITESENKA